MDDDGLADLPPRRGAGATDPAAWAIASLVLGILSLAGLGLLKGSSYVLPFTMGQSNVTRTVLAGLLGAAIAALAVVLAVLAQRRTHPRAAPSGCRASQPPVWWSAASPLSCGSRPRQRPQSR